MFFVGQMNSIMATFTLDIVLQLTDVRPVLERGTISSSSRTRRNIANNSFALKANSIHLHTVA